MKKLLLLALFPACLSAQEVWDLEKCINYAQTNNFSSKQAALNQENAALDNKSARLSRMPSVNASASQVINFGRSVDPTSYQFVQQTVRANSFSVNGNVPIYAGGRINNTVKQSQLNVAATLDDANQLMNDLALQVAQAYLNVLLAQEALLAIRDQKKQTENQLAQTQKLIDAGALAVGMRLDLDAQLARNEQNIVNGENSVALAELALKQVMGMDPGTEISLDKPAVDAPLALEPLSLEQLYEAALKNQPNIRAGETRVASAQVGIKIAKSASLPTLSGFANLQTNYSNLGRRITGYTTSQDTLSVEIPNVGQSDIVFNNQVPTTSKNPFFDQLWDNFNQQIGVSLSIPIYDQGRTKISTQKAELAVVSAQQNVDQLRLQLKADIARALSDARGAFYRHEAAKKTLTSLEAAFANTQKRFDAGAATAFELTTSQNNILVAKAELIQAKYDFIFKTKILDFYQGKVITLK